MQSMIALFRLEKADSHDNGASVTPYSGKAVSKVLLGNETAFIGLYRLTPAAGSLGQGKMRHNSVNAFMKY